jgi:lysozyme
MARKRAKRLSREQKWWLILLIGGFILILYFTLLNKWQARQEATVASVKYDAFGIELPPGYSIHGIDVSVHQGPIHWPSVFGMKEEDTRMGFAFIKATEGLNDTDKRFHKNWNDAKEAGMVRGAYHFFLATKSGKKQALQFIKQVQLKKGDLPPVVDIEKLYGVKPALMRERLKAYLQEIESYYRVKPIIYTYADFYERYLGEEFTQYPLWVAHYFQPDKPRINRSWQFWQHSEQGSINGIRSKIDCNVFNGDSVKFKQMLLP